MIGESAAIRKYQKKLPAELLKRYGGTGPYTEAQIDRTVEELGLSRKYIRYAYLMYCEHENLDKDVYSPDAIEKMNTTIATAASGGIAGGVFGGADGDGGVFGNGGGGGE